MADEPHAKLRAHFANKSDSTQASDWEALWEQNFSPWDRGRPSPPLAEYLISHKESFARTFASGKRNRALVPGCGRGYDVYLLSSFGYDAIGIDSSPTALSKAKALPISNDDFDTIYPTQDSKIGRGKAEFVGADFFSTNMLSDCELSFDLIYDYTFLCALPPSLRPQWATRMHELLLPGGMLVCLMFPLHKPPKTGGPPHGLSLKLYDFLLDDIGRDITYDAEGYATGYSSEGNGARVGSGKSFEKVVVWEPTQTHAAGTGHDRVGEWRKQ